MTRIFLIGYMGAGKTTLGRALARDLGVEFIDLDWYIEDRFHARIPDIFAREGEQRFRQMEQRMLHEVAQFEDVVIACGGGTPCFFDNMDFINAHAASVYLKATPQVLEAHLRMGKSVRPLIQGKTPEELRAYIGQSLAEREPFYAKATYTLPIDVIEDRSQIEGYVGRLKKLAGLGLPQS